MLDGNTMEADRLRLLALLSLELPALGIPSIAGRSSRLLEESRKVINQILSQKRGELVRAIGDNFLAVFDNCKDAVEPPWIFQFALPPLRDLIGGVRPSVAPDGNPCRRCRVCTEKSSFRPHRGQRRISRSPPARANSAFRGGASLLPLFPPISGPFARPSQAFCPPGLKGFILTKTASPKTRPTGPTKCPPAESPQNRPT